MKRRLISFLLAVAIAAAIIPAVVQPTQAAEAYNVVCLGSSIYAHGAPILIAEGTMEGRTSIYLDTNKNGIVDAGEQTLAGAGISGAPVDNLTSTKANLLKVFGGSVRTDFSGDTFITMSGGRIGSIIGGNAADYDKGYFSGTTYIKVTGGMVNEDVYIGNVHERSVTATNSTKGTLIVSGNAVIRAIIGGGNRGNAQFIGTTTGFVLADTTDKADSFQNGILKIDDTNYITKGTATAPASLPITIAAGETMTVKSGSNITINGKFVNKGTLIIEAGATLTLTGSGNANTGTVTNSGTFNCNSHAYANGCDVNCDFCGATRSASHNWKPATCDAPKTCPTCGSTEGTALGHSYRYSAAGKSITESCVNSCGHSATATMSVESSYTYTGEAITPAQVSYDANWKGPKPTVEYENNVNVGTAAASVTVDNVRLRVEFAIAARSLADATVQFTPEVASYNGKIQPPAVVVTLDGKTLVEGTDYNLSWNTNRILYPGDYIATVRGKGNFDGKKEEIFQIVKGDFTDVKVEQVGTLVYNGQRQIPTVSTHVVTADGLPVDFRYSTVYNGSYADMPYVGNAGTYTIYYWLKADDHNDYLGSFTVTVEKATVEVPILESKPYNGQKQEADVPRSDLYDVFHYSGTEAGEYEVHIRLTDDVNYRWSTTDDPWLSLKFTITPGENSWTDEPAISGWTYGQSPNAPTAAAKFGDVEVSYTGTANDGTAYNGTEAPTKAGSYTANFRVAATDSYGGLEKSVDFTIAKANYNLSGARWNYTQAYAYDGLEKNVTITGLPQGIAAQYSGNTAKAVGEYTATVTFTYDSHNYNQPAMAALTWHIANDWNPTEYVTSAPNSNGWLKENFVITPQEGYLVATHNTAEGIWETSLTYEGETDAGSVTIYLKNAADGTISLGKTVSYKLDKTNPTGKIQFVDRTDWEAFVNAITFGLFYKDEVTVSVEGADALSGVGSVEYACANKALTLDEVKAITDWTAYNGSFGVALQDFKRFVYFVRITDNAGNVFYLSSNGAEYDITAPAVAGVVTNNTYYTTQTVAVTDNNLESVTLNGAAATASLTLEGNREATYVIVATDKAGNTTTVTVKMRPISALAQSMDALTPENVTSAHLHVLNGVKASVTNVTITNATNEEKQALQEIVDRAKQLEKVLEDCQAEISRIADTLEDYDPATVDSNDRAGLTQLAKDIQALIDGNNLTDAERTALTKQAKDTAAMQKTIADTQAVNNRLQNTVNGFALETVTSDHEEALKKLLEEIQKHSESSHLTDGEAAQLNRNEETVEQLLDKIQSTEQKMQKLIDDVAGYREETINSSNQDAIEQIMQNIDALLATGNITEEEAEPLEEAKAKAEALLDIIQAAADATSTENTEKIKDITSKNVAVEDQANLEKARADLEKALAENAENYTEQEAKAIQDAINRIQAALDSIEKVKNVEVQLQALPEKIGRENEEEVAAVQRVLDALSDHEKSLVKAELKQALADATEAVNRSQRNFRTWIIFVIVLIAVALVAIPVIIKRKKR